MDLGNKEANLILSKIKEKCIDKEYNAGSLNNQANDN